MATDRRKLREFVRAGQEMLACDWTAHYGADVSRIAPAPPAIRYAQPGFLGDDYRGIVVVNQNPGVGDSPDRAKMHRIWDGELEKWLRTGTIQSYEEVFRFWQRDLSNWPVWKQWIAPILAPSGLDERNVAYLNLCKNQTRRNVAPTASMYWADWRWTRRQLEILRPHTVVAGGKAVADLLTRFWPEAPFKVVEQNRIRSQNNATRAQQASEIARTLAKAIAKNR
ncbi:MAG TPA: hypothetical protein VFY79_10990 [Dehalococcoidia bacterium]|nr:hypothetical protein [Dehalococcoidia bacterium]